MPNWNDLEAVHAGRIGLIIGNGPSLKDVPLEFLQKYISFGTNRIYLMQDFEPIYYVSVNPLVIIQSINQIKKLKSIKFVPVAYADSLNALPLTSIYRPIFSLNPQKYIYEGYTVTYVCMQIAHWMGFDTILLVGVDHRYTFTGAPNQEMIMDGDDPNHFHPDYFKGARWNNPDLKRSEQAYRMARQAYESSGKRIINLTENSALTIFEKDNIKNW